MRYPLRMPGTSRPHQLVDRRAAAWAGLLGGAVFFVLYAFWMPTVIGGNAWVMIRQLASVVLGDSVLAPPATFDGAALGVGLVVHLAISLGASYVLAAIIHRWGFLVGVVGGAFFGLAAYAIAVYGATVLFPWFFAMKSMPFLIAHVAFGAVAGGVYELIEVEVFVDDDGNVVPDPDDLPELGGAR